MFLGSKEVIPEDKKSLFLKLDDPDVALKVGDIILIEPTGLATLLYEVNSFSNAVFLTERCNCKCLMCPQVPKNSDSDDYLDLSLKTIALLDSRTEMLGITGGEPTLVWNDLIDVLKACRENIPKASIQLLTNARILKDIERVRELVSADNNNLVVCIPLYADVSSIHDEIVGIKGAFWETIEGIYNLERFGVPVEIRTVITKLNYKRLPLWSEFVYRSFPFTSHIALMGMEPLGLALKNLNQVWIDPLDYIPLLKNAVKILNRRNMNLSIYNHQLCTLPQSLWKFAKKSISEWKNVFFTECAYCVVRLNCGGFFQSSEYVKSRGIKRIVQVNKET